MAKNDVLKRVHSKVSEVLEGTDVKVTNKLVESLYDGFLDAIMEEYLEVKEVTFGNFGTFKTKHVEAHTGKNPQNQQPIEIPAKTAPVFKCSSTLKRVVKEHFAD